MVRVVVLCAKERYPNRVIKGAALMNEKDPSRGLAFTHVRGRSVGAFQSSGFHSSIVRNRTRLECYANKRDKLVDFL